MTPGASVMPDDQRDVIAFLKDPSTYGEGVDRVETIETHASLVFLAGDRVYKLKRAVKYPYLDFSTAEERRRACESELALNRRTAPALYLEVLPLTRTVAGAVSFSGAGEPVDWVVVMRRFDQNLLFEALAKTGGLDSRIIERLADQSPCFMGRPSGGSIAAVLQRCVASPKFSIAASPRRGAHALRRTRSTASSEHGANSWR
jgi:uncharacterized protein